MPVAKPLAAALCAAAAMALSGCAETRLHLSDDFGVAVKQDAAAQIADPDAQYAGTPAPGSDGSRVGLAQQRYQKGTVIKPTAAATSTAVSGGGGGGGGGDSGSASTGSGPK
jgi:hypothetical protein